MPARAAFPPRRVPLGFSLVGLFPEREVVGTFLFIRLRKLAVRLFVLLQPFHVRKASGL